MEKLLHERLIPDECGVCELECDGRVITLLKYDTRALRREIERYYIPRPRFEDGEPASKGCALDGGIVDDVHVSESGYYVLYDDEGNELDIGYKDDYIMRPKPKVLDADGIEINVGDTVYEISSGKEYQVSRIRNEIVDVFREVGFTHLTNSYLAKDLTHKEPDSLKKLRDDMLNEFANLGRYELKGYADRLSALIERNA